MNITRVDHIAVIVPSIEESLGFFRDVLGMQVTHTDVEEDQCVVVAFLATGSSELELIEPLSPVCGVGKFLERRGPGIHHVCLEVDDLDAAMAHLRANDVRLVDDQPHVGTGGRRIAFVHPKAAHGVMFELYEALPGDRSGRRLTSIDDLRRRMVAGGRVAAAGTRGFIAGLRTPIARGGAASEGGGTFAAVQEDAELSLADEASAFGGIDDQGI